MAKGSTKGTRAGKFQQCKKKNYRQKRMIGMKANFEGGEEEKTNNTTPLIVFYLWQRLSYFWYVFVNMYR
eukprot:UN09637